MTLSEQAATGSADREAVAIELGCTRSESGWWFCGGFRNPRRNPPDYQNDLLTTLAEIERRGWEYLTNSCGRGANKYSCSILTSDDIVYRAVTGTTIANAACAALLKALENSDGN